MNELSFLENCGDNDTESAVRIMYLFTILLERSVIKVKCVFYYKHGNN